MWVGDNIITFIPQKFCIQEIELLLTKNVIGVLIANILLNNY